MLGLRFPLRLARDRGSPPLLLTFPGLRDHAWNAPQAHVHPLGVTREESTALKSSHPRSLDPTMEKGSHRGARRQPAGMISWLFAASSLLFQASQISRCQEHLTSRNRGQDGGWEVDPRWNMAGLVDSPLAHHFFCLPCLVLG